MLLPGRLLLRECKRVLEDRSRSRSGRAATGVALFQSSTPVPTGNYVGNVLAAGTGTEGTCPNAQGRGMMTTNDFPEGPVPAGGGTVSDLEATVNTAPAAGKKTVVDVFDNTEAALLARCTITEGNTSCQSTAATPVAAGDYIVVLSDGSSNAAAAEMRVTFRY